MLVRMANENKKRFVPIIVVCIIIAAAIFLLCGEGNSKKIRTEEDRITYLQELGWQVSPQSVTVEQIELPSKFGEEYSLYLELQMNQGFDLAKYAGKRVQQYTYQVLNYPTGETGVVVQLLIYKGTVIGSQIQGSNFLHGLEMSQ